MGEPFSYVLEQLDLPAELAELEGAACVAEEEATGQQVTVEGYALDGEAVVYGVVDSISYPHLPTFQRYQYPSRLPDDVLVRLEDVSRRVITRIGLEAHTFNIEFFWDDTHGDLSLLEVNPRHSQSHAKLFELVDGLPNHACMIDLALGREPHLPRREGPYDVAAKWYLKRFADGVVTRVPSAEEIAEVEDSVADLRVSVLVDEGDRLSEQVDNDSYSYKLANVYLAANDEQELLTKYQRCVESLSFEFDEV